MRLSRKDARPWPHTHTLGSRLRHPSPKGPETPRSRQEESSQKPADQATQDRKPLVREKSRRTQVEKGKRRGHELGAGNMVAFQVGVVQPQHVHGTWPGGGSVCDSSGDEGGGLLSALSSVGQTVTVRSASPPCESESPSSKYTAYNSLAGDFGGRAPSHHS